MAAGRWAARRPAAWPAGACGRSSQEGEGGGGGGRRDGGDGSSTAAAAAAADDDDDDDVDPPVVVPVAGFFAAGEIGPVGYRSYTHSYTSSIALFRPRYERN
eukprot:COSAG01_NODE_467_length_16597_cov_10.933446_18_plen_102_part_00